MHLPMLNTKILHVDQCYDTQQSSKQQAPSRTRPHRLTLRRREGVPLFARLRLRSALAERAGSLLAERPRRFGLSMLRERSRERRSGGDDRRSGGDDRRRRGDLRRKVGSYI